MKILVIGGNGFIGSHLVDQLVSNGHHVRVFDNAYERYRKPISEVDYRISNLDSIPDLYEAMMGIDIIFHLASSSLPSTSNVDTINDVNSNLIPTLNVLNLAVKLGITRIIYFSSGGAVYGIPQYTPINEKHPIRPISSYGIVKATIESYLFLYQRLYGMKPLILRPSNPYGPRQGHYMAHGVISTFLRKIKTNEPLIVYGDGNSVKDYIFIKDLVEICYNLSLSDEVGVFNIGTGEGTSLNQIINCIVTVTRNSPEIVHTDFKNFDVPHFILDASKISGKLKIKPFTPLEEGIKSTWKWLNSV